MLRKIAYVIGIVAVTAGAVGVLWVSWRTSPTADPEGVTDRVRILAGVIPLVVLPWVGRRKGLFGPVANSITARLVRIAGSAGMCAIGLALVRNDRHASINGVAGMGAFNVIHEIGGIVLIGAVIAGPFLVMARRPQWNVMAVWQLSAVGALVAWVVMPAQLPAVLYAAAILAVTSRRSPVPVATLAIGAAVGAVVSVLAWQALVAVGDSASVFIVAPAMGFVAGLSAGFAAARQVSGIADSQALRAALLRQGALAGVVAAAAVGLVITALWVGFVFMMVIGPLAGAAGGAIGGSIVADRALKLSAAHDGDSPVPVPET